LRRWLGLAAAVLAAAPTTAAPRRVVSLNPCIDAILMEVADPAQIAAISHYSRDPEATSIPLSQAGRFPFTYETAEEVVALRPDLVIAGRHVALATRNALARLGVPILFVEVPESVAESGAQIRQVAAALGHAERGALLVARIEATLAKASSSGPPVPALIWQGGGLVPGEGTLASELLMRTGFVNASVGYGLKRWDTLPLEYLLAHPPKVIFTGIDHREPLRSRALRHRALGRIAGRVAVRDYPEHLLQCAGPNIIEAVARLSQARRVLQ
jgi:iron complex transport system substrate-binding protein